MCTDAMWRLCLFRYAMHGSCLCHVRFRFWYRLYLSGVLARMEKHSTYLHRRVSRATWCATQVLRFRFEDQSASSSYIYARVAMQGFNVAMCPNGYLLDPTLNRPHAPVNENQKSRILWRICRTISPEIVELAKFRFKQEEKDETWSNLKNRLKRVHF